MHVQLRRDRRLNHVEKLAKFPRALPLVELAEHLARLHVQSRKQRGGADSRACALDLPGRIGSNGRVRSNA